MMNLIFLAALFFVVIFAVVLQLITRCPFIPAAIVALVSLIVYAFLSETLGTIFIAWIIAYTLTALLAAWLTNLFGRNNRCNSYNQNNNCGCNRCNLTEGCGCNRCNSNDGCNSCDCNDF
ncbi:MAG: DUF2651 family protein [Clostridia bacterium]|nr:DUF2651 family protein [Clostridia bacterium]